MEIRHSSLYCPRDFDISPYFNVVKPTIARGFDYKRLCWADLFRVRPNAAQIPLVPAADGAIRRSGGDGRLRPPLFLAARRRYLCRGAEAIMIDDVIQAITQMFSPPLRAVLWKTVGLALALIVVAGIALQRLIVHLIGTGSASLETTLGPQAHEPVSVLAWLLSFAAGLRHRRRQRAPDAGGHRDRRQLLRRPDRRRGRARTLSGRSAWQGAAAFGSRFGKDSRPRCSRSRSISARRRSCCSRVSAS